MRFDDRLLTVLSQPVGDRHDAAVRWRQLVDLVARAGPDSGSAVVARALETIRADAPEIDEELRAAAARAVAGRPLPMGLLEYLVSDRLSVSAPVLAAATLEPAQWQPLLRLADEETRQFIEALHPEVVRVQPEPVAEPVPAEAAAPAEEGTRPPAPSLSDVVARIERRRRAREAQRSAAVAAAVPVEAPSVFRWECGPGGEIAWVDGAPRGALIGRSIARVQNGERVDDEVVRAFARRAPFRDAEMSVAGEGLVAGSWKISGLPAFNPTDGRFAGYRGIAQRDSAPPAPVRRDSTPDVLNDPDSLRELVHEIKTPLNAIIGFAEIIEGQYLGPADHRYRERAGEIVGQARLLLGAIDDLDFAAKIHSSAASERRVDLGALIESADDPLAEAARKSVELELSAAPANTIAAVEPEIAERLLARLATAVIDQARPGEHLRVALERTDSSCRLSISRPAALNEVPDALLFDGASSGAAKSGAGISAGFSLRLVRGLARIAGGDLTTSPTSLTLVFPRVT